MKLRITIITVLLFLLAMPSKANIDYMNLDWWGKYNDEILMTHLHNLYENNHELKIAAYNTKQAQENIRLASSGQFPQVSLDTEFVRTMRGGQTQFGNLIIPTYSQNHFYLPLNASYEIDIWGENYLKRKSAKLQKFMLDEEERSTYLLLTSNFVSCYFNLIKADEQEKITKEIIEIQTELVSMTEKKYNHGLVSINELLNEKQLLVKQEEELNNIKKYKKTLNNQLVTLLGLRSDEEIKHTSLKDLTYPASPNNLSADILQNRPDLQRAEKYAKKVGVDVSIAKRDFLPKFILFGNIGFNAYRWNKIFNDRTFLSNIGIAPQVDLFTGGYKTAKFRINKFEYKKASEIYEQTVLTSMQELNDALCIAKNTKENFQKSQEDVEIEMKKYTLAQKQYYIGDSSKFDEMKSKINLLLVEQRHISSKINDAISSISLYNATGGFDYTKSQDL